MSSIRDKAPPAGNDRVQLTMLEGAAAFLNEYGAKHDLTAAETVRRALGLLALVDEMDPAEDLWIAGKGDGVYPVELPWRSRLARRVPDLNGKRPARRRAVR